MNRAVFAALILALAIAMCSGVNASDRPAGSKHVSVPAQLRLPSEAQVGVTAGQVSRALTGVAEIGKERLRSNAEITRGSTVLVYGKVAPATVLVHTGNAYGTGFLIAEDGWILTNHHVAAEGPIDVTTGVRLVKVYLGHMHGRIMAVDEPEIVAVVYKTSEEKDLALLKLTMLPDDVKSLPVVPIAEKGPSPGSDCVAIGHPRAGMMWTVRSGEVSGIGKWPGDMIHVVTARLSASKEDAEQLKKTLSAAPERKVLISSCGCNPGDSGGPLVDLEGNLIGVTYAIPRADEGEGISLDKFSYHIHLDEVKAFIKDRPAAPRPFIPDPWPAATLSAWVDHSRDKIRDTLIFGFARDKPCTGILSDLDQDSSVDFDPEQLDKPGMRDLWDFEFGFQRVPVPRTFYDTDNDGRVDLILTDADGDKTADLVLKLKDGTWKAAPMKDQPMFDLALFADEDLGRRFSEMFGGKPKPAKKPQPAKESKPVEKPKQAEKPETAPPHN